MNATWAGRDCKFVWRRASNFGSFEFGSEPFGASSGAPDPALDYLVQVLDASGKTLRTEYVKETSYIYSYERNFEDTGGAPARSFTVKVWARNTYLLAALPAILDVSNPQSLPPTAVALVGSFKSIFLQIVPPTDPDWSGTLVFMSTSAGFVPSGLEAGQGNCVYSGADKLIVINALPATTYYLQYASFDAFGRDNLVLSGEVSVATGSIVNTDIAAGTITADRLLVSILSAITADAGEITAGSIRGVNVNASSHTTKGSYLTSAPGGGATTLNVKNTADFPSSGSGVIIDTTNDRDAFTYTGKTSTTLTGCSGVLSHNADATIIPLAKGMVIDAATNEMRFYGDRGDGTIEELASIGLTGFGGQLAIGTFGSVESASGKSGLVGVSKNNEGVLGLSVFGSGVAGLSSSDVGGMFNGNATRGNLLLNNANGSTFPTNKDALQLAQVGGRLYYADGTNWLPLTRPYFISSQQTITSAGSLTIAHGLGFRPENCSLELVAQNANNNYSVGDHLQVPLSGDLFTVSTGVSVVLDSTNINVRFANDGANQPLRALNKSTGNFIGLPNADWKAVFKAW